MAKHQWLWNVKIRIVAAFSAVLLGAMQGEARAVFIGLTNDFQDGTTQDWGRGAPSPNPPEIAPDGRGGADDLYVLMESYGGDTAGSRMAVFNDSQWSGNYLAAGITSIQVDLNNVAVNPPGTTPFADMVIRLAFMREGGTGANGVVTSDTYFLPTNSGWQTVTFSLAASDLIAVGGADLTEVMSDVEQFRIISAELPTSVKGDPIQAQLGFDNVIAIPEPSAGALLLAGVAAACAGAGVRWRNRHLKGITPFGW
ncbi:MAG: hypothetical protein ACOY3P_15825 [Planctomycetota bacterium]